MADVQNVTDDEVVDDEVIEGEKETTKTEAQDGEEEDGETEETEEEEIIDENKVDVPVRKSTLEHIIARKNKKIQKLENASHDNEEENEDDESGLSEEALKAVDNAVAKRIKPVEEREINRESENLLQDLYTKEPEAKPFDKVIRKFMSFEKNGFKPYEHIPPEVIFHHLSYGSAEKRGAQKRALADEEAGLSRSGGRGKKAKNTKTTSGLPSIEAMENMDDGELTKIINKSTMGK